MFGTIIHPNSRVRVAPPLTVVLSMVLLFMALLSACAPRLAPGSPGAVPEPGAPLSGVVHHQMVVRLDPDTGAVAVRDRITLPVRLSTREQVSFLLARGLTLSLSQPGAEPVPRSGTLNATQYRLTPSPDRTILVEYGGSYPLPAGAEPGGEEGISPTFALLSGNGAWYPQILEPAEDTAPGDTPAQVTFSMTVLVPPAWTAVSQGMGPLPPLTGFVTPEGTAAVRWSVEQPQEQIYLVAAPFTKYELAGSTTGSTAVAQAFLLHPDPELANRYLAATRHFLDLYADLIGPYPYAKFALVENPAPTGWGMPSFTLMGGTVLRLPFILESSFPHEIAHNWWGNGVFVDYGGGNWSEGLTRYLADHLVMEARGKGAEYRREALQAYADYVLTGKDFPLTRFVTRDSESSQAVGYGKGMMLFHMLRVQLGDEAFLHGLTTFYDGQRFHHAGWNDVRRAFEQTSGRDLKAVFDQWLTRVGAPELELVDAVLLPKDPALADPAPRHMLLTLRQTQEGPPYLLYIPVAVTSSGADTAAVHTLRMDQKQQSFDIQEPDAPLYVAVDPYSDVFRRLGPDEAPPALSALLGAEKPLFVVPSGAPTAVQGGWLQLARSLAARSHGEVVFDNEFSRLPAHRAVWVLGWQNRHVEQVVAGLIDAGAVWTDQGLIFPEGTFPRSHTLVTALRDPMRDGAPLGWIGSDTPGPLSGLARKLPHYGKYGYLAFTGDEPQNVLKNSWPVRPSPLARAVTGLDGFLPASKPAPLPTRPVLGGDAAGQSSRP
ncbi:MAG: M1 family aminopeptidase [Nitrospirota bacterium]|nr:M1 family aminopeptidase [Nitrospirota bacterium]